MKKTKQFKPKTQFPKLEKLNYFQQENKTIISNKNPNIEAVIWFDQQIEKNEKNDNLWGHLKHIQNESQVNCGNYNKITKLISTVNQEANVVLFTGSETAFEQLFNLSTPPTKDENKIKLIVHNSLAIKKNNEIAVYLTDLEHLRQKQIAFIPLKSITKHESYYTLLQTNSLEELVAISSENPNINIVESTRKYIVLKYDKTNSDFKGINIDVISTSDKDIQNLRSFTKPKKKKENKHKRIELEIPNELLIRIDRNKPLSTKEWENYWLKMLDVWFMKHPTNVNYYLKDIIMKTQKFLTIKEKDVSDSVKLHMLQQLKK